MERLGDALHVEVAALLSLGNDQVAQAPIESARRRVQEDGQETVALRASLGDGKSRERGSVAAADDDGDDDYAAATALRSFARTRDFLAPRLCDRGGD